MATIDELVALIPPPKIPAETEDANQWESICAEIGTALPEDLRQIGIRYGSGHFIRNDIYIANPFASWYFEYVKKECERIVESLDAGLFDKPYKVFPEESGLYPIGSDENGNSMFWLTEGVPDEWPIILHGHGYEETEQWNMPLCQFLVDVFTNKIRCLNWPKGFKKEELDFIPSKPSS